MSIEIYAALGAMAGYVAAPALLYLGSLLWDWFKSWHRCRTCGKVRPCNYSAISCSREVYEKNNLRHPYYRCRRCIKLPIKLIS